MEFFNRKEEVVDLQLTQYGKYLLSRGKFKPSAYAFFDDDVIYDATYGPNKNEHQNATEDRIKETPRIKCQSVFHGIETEVAKINEMVRSNLSSEKVTLGAKKIQPTQERSYALPSPLGTSAHDAQYSPAWRVKYLIGELSGSTKNLKLQTSNGDTKFYKIPQLETDYTFTINNFINLEEDIVNAEIEEFGELTADKALSIEEHGLVIEVNEENTIFEKDNFEVEVFLIDEKKADDGNPTGEEELIPLYYGHTKKKVNNLNLDNFMSQAFDLDDPSLQDYDSSYIEHFFEVLVDNEIDTELLCRLVGDRKSKGVFSETSIDCAIDQNETMDIYSGLDDDPGEIC